MLPIMLPEDHSTLSSRKFSTTHVLSKSADYDRILSPYDELSESETECANEETSHVASSTSEGWDPFIGKSGEVG